MSVTAPPGGAVVEVSVLVDEDDAGDVVDAEVGVEVEPAVVELAFEVVDVVDEVALVIADEFDAGVDPWAEEAETGAELDVVDRVGADAATEPSSRLSAATPEPGLAGSPEAVSPEIASRATTTRTTTTAAAASTETKTMGSIGQPRVGSGSLTAAGGGPKG